VAWPPPPKWATYADWKRAFFTPDQQADSNVSGQTADPDADGSSNLLEYAMYTDPNNPGENPQPTLLLDSNYLSIVYTRADAVTDVTFAVQESAGLNTWNVVTPINQVLSDDGFSQKIKASVPRSDGPDGKLFLRLQVTQQ
jgi:hypothetical protein